MWYLSRAKINCHLQKPAQEVVNTTTGRNRTPVSSTSSPYRYPLGHPVPAAVVLELCKCTLQLFQEKIFRLQRYDYNGRSKSLSLNSVHDKAIPGVNFALSACTGVIQVLQFLDHTGVLSRSETQFCEPRPMPFKTIQASFGIPGPSSQTPPLLIDMSFINRETGSLVYNTKA